MSDYFETTPSRSESCNLTGGETNINTNDGATNTLIDQKQKVLDWLRELSSIDHYNIQLETYAMLVPDTCSWILREPRFQAWLVQKSGTFWGVGIPGAGKSVLTSYVINYLQDRAATPEYDEIIIFVYCRYKDNLTVSKILAALLGQLYERSRSTSYVCEKFYNLCNKTLVLPTERDLFACIQTAVDLVPSKIYFAIDALDELQDDIRESLVETLLLLGQSIFLTSRELSLSSLSYPDIHILVPAQEFSTFIVYQLRKFPRLWSLLETKKDLLGKVVETIQLKSDGMFLFAALQLSTMRRVTNTKGLHEALDTLPTALNAMYEMTLKGIMDQSEEEQDLACHAILWVIHGFRPLKVSELLEALAIDPDSTGLNIDGLTSPQVLITVCCGLLTIEQETGLVQLTHSTAIDFFASQTFGSFESPHNFMATICAQYLHFSGFSDHEIFTYKDLEVVSTLQPFADYACRYLGDHVFHASVENNGEIPPLVYSLLSQTLSIPLSHKCMAIRSPGPNHYDIDYGHLIHLAALYGLQSVVTNNHESLKETSQNGYAPILYAIMGGHTATVELMAEAGADVNARNIQKETGLHLAAEQDHEAVVKLLLSDPRVDPNAQDDHGHTPLHFASTKGHETSTQLLLSHPELDINKEDSQGCSALHYAAVNGNQPIVQHLLAFPGINVNAKDAYGYTGLHRAVMNGHNSVVQLLLSTPGVDINARDNQGHTPLYHASINGHEALTHLIFSFSVISSMESSIVCAEDVATFLTKEEGEIVPKLNNGLLELGYDGPYYLQAGFNEELLCRNIVHPEVFLHLDGNLECDDTIMSQILSPIFAPHTTILNTHSQVYSLFPPSNHDIQASFQLPASACHLDSSQQSQAIETSQGSQGSSQRSTGRSSQNGEDNSEGQPPSDERDGEQQRPLMEEVEENGSEDAADDCRRRLELQLDVPLTISTGLGNNGYVHEFCLKTNINVELRRNRDGNSCPEGLTSIKTPWSSIKFPNITISAGETMLYSFSALKVHVEATPKYTECNHLLPTTVGPTGDVKRIRDKRKKRAVGFTGGFMKGELKGEQTSEQGAGEESTIPIWSIDPHNTKKWKDKNARQVTVDYTYNGFDQVRTQAFEPGPQAVFSYEPLQTGRTLRVFIRALWALETDGLENRFSHIFDKLRDKVAGRDKPLIYANFFHKISFGINLEDLIPIGEDDDILKGNNRRFDEDSFQDGHRVRNCDKPIFEPMPVQITLNGEKSSIEIPLRRSITTAIHGGTKEGKRQVTSPDPDPFTSAPH